jgi:hypothetical protein
VGLLGLECVGGGLAAYQISTGYKDIQKLSNGTQNGQIPEDLSPAYSRVGIIVVGTAAFLFSWFDDMSGAPIAAEEYNKRADEAASHAQLHLLPLAGGAQLAYTKQF